MCSVIGLPSSSVRCVTGEWFFARSRSSSSPSPQGVEEGPRVIELFAIDDDPELQGVLVAEHGDVQADPVEHPGDRELRTLACTAEVQRRR